MPGRQNFRQRVLAREPMVGMINFSAASWVVELAGLARYDFVFICTEHTVATWDSVDRMILAARATDVPAVVRVADVNEAEILRACDAGADALCVSHISTAQQAEAIVRYAKYPPRGCRGLGPGRASNFIIPPWREHAAKANDEMVVIAIVEDRVGVDNIDEICAVEGLDVIFLGGGDLSQDLGLDFVGIENAEMNAATSKVRDACLKHDKGLLLTSATTPTPENIRKLWAYGGSMVLHSWETLVLSTVFNETTGALKDRPTRV